MGFLSGFGRLLAGKPVFENNGNANQPTGEVSSPESTQGAVRDESGRKIIPEVEVSHVKSNRNGNSMTVTAWVTNHSDLAIRLDDCTMLSQRLKVHYELAPQQGHQVVLYRGSIPTNEHDYRTRLTFRLVANTDEFEIDYTTEFYLNSDGTYMVEELHPQGGVRDI